ncbi:MAG: NTP transferase domain-containing protein [Thermodesulfobacteriota bacterium]
MNAPLRRAVIPAAGLGARMRAVDPLRPKELLPVAGRPLILHALEEAALAGCAEAVVVIRPGKEDLRRLLEDPAFVRREYPAAAADLARILARLQVHFAYQELPRGECDAILAARGLLGDDPFAVVYPDNLPWPSGALARACETYASTGLDTVALMAVDADAAPALPASGRVDLAPRPDGLFTVERFLTKQPGPFAPRFPGELRTCGLYAARPHYLDFIARAAERFWSQDPRVELTDGKVRRIMLAGGVEFVGAPLAGTVLDAGTPAGYARCRDLFEGRVRH